jgi:hypothetical protein
MEPIERSLEQKYARAGHPSIEEMKAAQGTVPVVDARAELFGKAWPEDESVDEFLTALREWRRSGASNQAA